MKSPQKSLLALAIAVSTLSPLAMAAPAAPEPSKPHATQPARAAHANPLKDAVVASWKLDGDQLAALAQADSEWRAGMKSLHDDKADPAQRRAAIDDLLAQQRERLNGVLSDEQLHAYQMLERPQPGMRHHGGPRPDPERLAADFQARYQPLFATWNLSQNQSAEVLNAQRTFFDGLHQMKRPGASVEEGAKDARGAQFKQLLEQRHATLSAVLEQDQVTAFEALTQPPRGPHGDSRQGPRAEGAAPPPAE